MATRSVLSNYKHKVRHALITKFHWKPTRATNWIRDHKDYMIAMMESVCPPYETAELIHNMKENQSAQN